MKKALLTLGGAALAGGLALTSLSAGAWWGNWGDDGWGGPWYGGPWYGGGPYGWGNPYGGWGYPYGGWGYPYGGWGYPYGGWGYPYGGMGYPLWGAYPYAVAPAVVQPAAPAKSTSSSK